MMKQNLERLGNLPVLKQLSSEEGGKSRNTDHGVHFLNH